MSIPVSMEKRLLTPGEYEAVRATHHPDVRRLSWTELTDAVRRIRDLRDKNRARLSRQRREMRGKADPRGARPATDDRGTSIKQEIFASAVKRMNQEMRRRKETDRSAPDGTTGTPPR